MNSNQMIKNIALITIFSGLTYSFCADLTEDPGITASTAVELTYLREKALSGNVKEVKSLIEKADHLREYALKNLISDLNFRVSQMKSKELSTDTDEELRKNIFKNIELINAYLERRKQKMDAEAENDKCRKLAKELVQFAIKGNVEKVELYLTKEKCSILLAGVIQEIKFFVEAELRKGKLVKNTDKYNKIKRCVELIQGKIESCAQSTQDKLHELGRKTPLK